MPRPKRAKVAPSAPTAIPFLERAKADALSAAPLLNQNASNDDSQGLVKQQSARSGRTTTGKGDFMSGALVRGSTIPSQKTLDNNTTTTKSRDFDDLYDVSDKENERPAKRTTTSKQKGAVQNTPSTFSQQRRGHDGQLSRQNSHTRRNPQATPLADSSMLSLAGFKRRPRQPSILGIGQPDDTPTLSSLGDLSGDSGDDLDDFQPQDESTPLQLKAARPRQPLQPSDSQQQRDEPADLLRSTPPGSRKRKLARDAVLVPRSERSASLTDTQDQASPPAAAFGLSSASDDEPTLPSPRKTPAAPIEIWDEVMAPPQSNSSFVHASQEQSSDLPLGSDPASRPEPVQVPKTRRQGAAKRQQPPGPSTASLQNLLPRRQGRKSRVSRANYDANADLSLSEADDDQDELSFTAARRHNTKKAGRSAAGGQKNRHVSATKKAAAGSSKGRPEPAASTSRDAEGKNASAAPRRTYSRRSGATEDINESLVAADDDGEFAPGEDPSPDGSTLSLGLPEEAKKELRKVSQKFEVIDQWEMEFEDVSGRSSSPGFAR